MQAHLLVGPAQPIIGLQSSHPSSPSSSSSSSHGSWPYNPAGKSRSRWFFLVASSSSHQSSASPYREQNYYSVLGLARNATSADIKKAFRLLARKYHPDVCKDSQCSEVFKRVRRAYEVLSNEVTRIQYDRKLKFRGDSVKSHGKKWNYNSEHVDGARIYQWSELRRKRRQGRYQKHYNSMYQSFDDDTDNEAGEQTSDQERGSFIEVLGSTFLSLFLFKTLGARFSLTFSTISALFDRRLDGGYKVGYLIAWILGGSGGILLTLCLSFASWACGKTSSSIVALVVVAMWIGSNLATVAHLPQGALITLLYLSLKLQVDLHK